MTGLSEEKKSEIKEKWSELTQDYEGFFEQYVCCSGGTSGDVDCACNGINWSEMLFDFWLDIIDRELRGKVEEVRGEIENYANRENFWDEKCKDRFNKGALRARNKMRLHLLSLPSLGAEGLSGNKEEHGT